MNDRRQNRFTARDGVELVWHERGDGRPVVLLHGLFSSATVNWIRYGHADTLAEAGFRVVMPDLRAHGDSGKPHDDEHYPPDVLVDDLCDLIEHLKLSDFDLGGFSLGARTCVRAVIQGLAVRRLVLGGMGLSGLAGWGQRSAFFERAIARYETAQRGEDIWMAIQFMKTMKVDRVAAAHVLKSITDTQPDALQRITMPTLVVCGEQDRDNGSPEELLARLPQGTLVKVPGNHMSSVTQAALGRAMADFLSA
ncbi:MAG: alpha/beta fold hydrolase [Gammaproteobacteria bacterium]|nr:MAG: alpha/beta fold hydrolase [Gammaproteobacteria bacterium]